MSHTYEMKSMNPVDLVTAAPFSELFPISPGMMKAVRESMEREGFHLSKPIEVWDQGNIVIDGHTRRQAAIDLGLTEVPTVLVSFSSEDEALLYAIANQRDRRNLTDNEIIHCVDVVHKRKPHGGDRKSVGFKASGDALKSKTAEQTAEIVGISTRKVEKALAILDAAKADPSLTERVEQGESINKVSSEVYSRKRDSKRNDVTDGGKDVNGHGTKIGRVLEVLSDGQPYTNRQLIAAVHSRFGDDCSEPQLRSVLQCIRRKPPVGKKLVSKGQGGMGNKSQYRLVDCSEMEEVQVAEKIDSDLVKKVIAVYRRELYRDVKPLIDELVDMGKMHQALVSPLLISLIAQKFKEFFDGVMDEAEGLPRARKVMRSFARKRRSPEVSSGGV